MAMIAINNLTFAWEGQAGNVFSNESFILDTDWRVGLIGRNGRGKTTLLRLLAESDSMPHEGTISSPAGFRYFPFVINEPSKNTMDIIGELCPALEFWELRREANLLGVSEDVLLRPFDTLSPGERAKTLLATMFIGGDEFVLLDEPTNHLDNDGKLSVTNYLRSKKGFIVVSHDRGLLDSVCDHIVSIGKSEVEVMAGNYSTWADEKKRRDRGNVAENERLRKDVRRLKEAVRRAAEWSAKVEGSKYGNGPVDRGFIGHRAAKLMKRSKAIEARQFEAASKTRGLLKDIDTPGSLKIAPLAHHSDTLVEIREMEFEYLRGKAIDLLVRKGERIALTGGNGSGKSSALKAIVGELAPHAGTVKTASGLVISYIPQEMPALSGGVHHFARESGIDLTLLLSIMANLGIPSGEFDTDISLFSDGQKRKLLLAKSLCESAHLYLWDEPLNFIDIISREQIEDMILEYAPTMVFVEHDAVFTSKVSTRAIEI